MVPGGRVELPTPAFSGPRSTGELPRHRGSQRFYGRTARVSMFRGWRLDARGWSLEVGRWRFEARIFKFEEKLLASSINPPPEPTSSTHRTRASTLSPSTLRAALYRPQGQRCHP